MTKLFNRPLVLLELNEVNFDFVRFYIDRGKLPSFARLIRDHGVQETRSEDDHDHLEPWIQWVTAHTGQTFAQHGVYRLGDIVHTDIPQIWEMVEQAGIRVGAVSPMNAKHRLREPAFFIPDPWTPTRISASPSLVRLHRALSRAVNDNAHGRLQATAAYGLLAGFITHADPRNYSRYARLSLTGRRYPWRKALFLDLLLADVFGSEFRRTRPGFATLFLNAAAHIQHHYMFCSPAYDGACRNPRWYVDRDVDPLLEAYELYDVVLRQMLARLPDLRLMIATGLHQDPHGEVTFYWRLRDHARFLREINVPHVSVEPRMSRDFVVVCASPAEAAEAERRLVASVALDGEPLFAVDNRGSDLFVMLTYSRDISPDFQLRIGGERVIDLYPHVVFVALKNGEHNGTGYFLDTAARTSQKQAVFALAELPQRIRGALGLCADARSSELGRRLQGSVAGDVSANDSIRFE